MKKKKIILGVIGGLVLGAGIGVGSYYLLHQKESVVNNVTPAMVKSRYYLSGNSLENFDIAFLNLENNEKNMLYSPLSIKYALEMLSEGSAGESKTEIDSILGKYTSKKYTNSSNMSLANALFVQENYKKNIKESYVNTLKGKYNADVIYDSFTSPDKLNSWVDEKTLGLIKNLESDVSDEDFILVNALAIDMEWKNVIQPLQEKEPYDKKHSTDGNDFLVEYKHESNGASKNPTDTFADVNAVYGDGEKNIFDTLKFVNDSVKSLTFAAVINNYDIVSDLGEENIRSNITNKYNEFVANKTCGDAYYDPTETVVNNYINEIKANYQDVASSTDFRYADTKDAKVFAKELKEYNGTTLEYIAIMPKEVSLKEYISTSTASSLNDTLKSLKDVSLNNSESGYITKINGQVPLFKFDYELNLKEDLQKIGVNKVFDQNKADLSKLTSMGQAYINKTSHKANIEFSNEGIKASAVTLVGGTGDIGCYFDYLYDVPIKTIDLTFNKPFMFIIRDAQSGEVWFTGTVYNPELQD